MIDARYPTRNITTARASLRRAVKDDAPYSTRRKIGPRIYALLSRRRAKSAI